MVVLAMTPCHQHRARRDISQPLMVAPVQTPSHSTSYLVVASVVNSGTELAGGAGNDTIVIAALNPTTAGLIIRRCR